MQDTREARGRIGCPQKMKHYFGAPVSRQDGRDARPWGLRPQTPTKGLCPLES